MPEPYERKDTSWVLEAIEREALSRARRVLEQPGNLMIGGCSVAQIMWLIRSYEDLTDEMASDIDPCWPTKKET